MDALALLRLHIEWGADDALEDAPVNRLHAPPPGRAAPGAAARSAVPQAAPPGAARAVPPGAAQAAAPGAPRAALPAGVAFSPRPPDAPPPARPPAGTAAERAAAAAGQAQTLDDLHAAMAAFDGCALRDTAANLVFAAGNPDAGLLLIGDPPAEAEDRGGTPFAGPEGALLDRMLASIGLTRDDLLATPMIPWRPPGGRPPNPAEVTLCLPFLHRLIALVLPRRVLIAGPLAARTLLATTRRRDAAAWSSLTVAGVAKPIPALAMPSPKLVAETPKGRREAWAALRLLRHALDADQADQ
jgi:DNA polymerase